MKNIFYLLICSLVMLVGCNGDPKTMVVQENIVPSAWLTDEGEVFPSHGDDFTLSKDDADLLFDTVRWTPTDFGYGAAITYTIQMAVEKDAVLGEYKAVAATTSPKYGFTVKEFNSGVLTAGGLKRQPNKVFIRIAASISAVYGTVYSQPYEFTVSPFSTDPDLLYFVPAVGTVTQLEYIFSPGWNGAYDGYAYIPYAAEGIWLVEELYPNVKWGIDNSTAQGATLTLKKESEGGQPIKPGAFGTGNIEASFVADGYYRASVKIQEATKSIQLWRFYGKFFIAGQRNMNYQQWGQSMSNQNPDIAPWDYAGIGDMKSWGTGVTLTYNPAERVWTSAQVYIPKYQAGTIIPGSNPPAWSENTSLFQFKLRANFGSSWGSAANLGGTADPIASDGIQRGNVVLSGSNVNMNVAAGIYVFKVYLNQYPLRYELVPATAN